MSILLWFVLSLGINSTAIVTAADDCCYLDAPSDLVVIDTDNDRITIGWNDNSGVEEGFVIERCGYIHCMENFSLFKIVALVSENINFYTDEDIHVNTTYLYRVKAYNDGSESEYSNIAAARSSAPEVVVYCFIDACFPYQ